MNSYLEWIIQLLQGVCARCCRLICAEDMVIGGRLATATIVCAVVSFNAGRVFVKTYLNTITGMVAWASTF